MKKLILMTSLLIFSSQVVQAQTGTSICQVQSRSGSPTAGLCQTKPAGTPATTQPTVSLGYQGQGTPQDGQFPNGQFPKPRWCQRLANTTDPVLAQHEATICNSASLSAKEIAYRFLNPPLETLKNRTETVQQAVLRGIPLDAALSGWYDSAIQQLQSRAVNSGGNTQGQVAYSANAPAPNGGGMGGMPWCGKTLTASEQVLCQMASQYPEIIQLDEALTLAYKAKKSQTKKGSSQRKALQAKQRSALVERDKIIAGGIAGGNAQLVILHYQGMIAALQ